MSRGKLSSADLISQIQSFYSREEEYKILFSISKGDIFTQQHLCNSVCNDENYIQKLALKILAIILMLDMRGYFQYQNSLQIKEELDKF